MPTVRPTGRTDRDAEDDAMTLRNNEPTCYRCGKQPCVCRDRGTLYHGDALQVLRGLPAGIIQCCVTSPPYFALRSYLAKDDPLKPLEIGSEPTVEAFIQVMVEVFREVKRVLRDDGTLFLNLGDSYDAGTSSKRKPGYGKHGYWNNENIDQRVTAGLPPGNLLNIPHRVAEALRADGWVWRQTIIFAKKSPMPESVSGWRWVRCRVKVAAACTPRRDGHHSEGFDAVRSLPVTAHPKTVWSPCPGCAKCEPHSGYVLRRGAGRCTTAHEYVFVFAKSGKYFWDGEASKEKARYGRMEWKGNKYQCVREADPRDKRGIVGQRSTGTKHDPSAGRNPRNFWLLSSEPTSVRHFATFPSELVRRCLVAGCSASGCCPTCRAPWAPVVESVDTGLTQKMADGWDTGDGGHGTIHRAGREKGKAGLPIMATKTLGYRPTCCCYTWHDGTILDPKTLQPAGTQPVLVRGEYGEPAQQLVLDPFCGIGTTGQTALHLGHAFIGIDLNSRYLDVAATRIAETPRWRLRQLIREGKKASAIPAANRLRQGVLPI